MYKWEGEDPVSVETDMEARNAKMERDEIRAVIFVGLLILITLAIGAYWLLTDIP